MGDVLEFHGRHLGEPRPDEPAPHSHPRWVSASGGDLGRRAAPAHSHARPRNSQPGRLGHAARADGARLQK